MSSMYWAVSDEDLWLRKLSKLPVTYINLEVEPNTGFALAPAP
jgi:hypothetical protein